MMKVKTIYFIRHSEQLKNNGNTNINELEQVTNEKIVLSVEGEKKAEKLSELGELSNIDELFSSNYVRAIETAKYIANKNGININIDERLNERKLGDLAALQELGKTKKYPYTIEQMLDENLKNKDGESKVEVAKRMNEFLEEILKNENYSKIAVVSHGAAIKFLLMNWCKLNSNNELEYKNKTISLDSPRYDKTSI